MIISDRPPLSSLLRILLLVVLVGWLVIGQSIGAVVGMLIYGDGFLSAMGDPTNHPDLRNALLFSQGIGSAVGMILVPWLYLKTSEHRSFTGFFRDEKQWPILFIAIFVGIMGLSAGISPIAEWNTNLQFPEWMSGFGRWVKDTEAIAAEIVKSITSNFTPGAFILTFVVVAIIPGIGEELVYRGLIQTELQRTFRNPHVAIWLAAAIFSAIHLQFLGFFPRMILGAFFGYLYFWSGNLWIPVIGHFLNNGIQVVALYLYQKGIITVDLESTESAPLSIVAVGIVLTSLILYYLKNYFTSRSTSTGGLV